MLFASPRANDDRSVRSQCCYDPPLLDVVGVVITVRSRIHSLGRRSRAHGILPLSVNHKLTLLKALAHTRSLRWIAPEWILGAVCKAWSPMARGASPTKLPVIAFRRSNMDLSIRRAKSYRISVNKSLDTSKLRTYLDLRTGIRHGANSDPCESIRCTAGGAGNLSESDLIRKPQIRTPAMRHFDLLALTCRRSFVPAPVFPTRATQQICVPGFACRTTVPWIYAAIVPSRRTSDWGS